MIEGFADIKSLSVHLLNRLRNCADVLLLNGSFVDDIGLGKGKMGIAIFLYHYSRSTGNKLFENNADELIDAIYEEISSTTIPDFDNGLAGIGWGIEYLSGNNFVEGDTDEILKELDTMLSDHFRGLPVGVLPAEMIKGYELYLQARKKTAGWDGSEIFSFIRKPVYGNESFSVTSLINPDNYGLFNGLAGEAMILLRELCDNHTNITLRHAF